MSAPLPERIGRYRITARIGRGAMGIVYAARDDQVGRDVAVKMMMADIEDEPETRARFFREAQAAGCLFHRNIITIYDIGEQDGRVYLVMELLKGQTLPEFLARPDGVTLEEKIDLMVQVCDGLASAHAHGVYHRDIKPGNLFVRDDGTLKILDFGVARLASSTMTASGYIIGTPDYMSPEQARGQEIDQRSDVFSAGAVFYFLVTGRKPFAARDLPEVLRKVQNDDPTPLTSTEAPPPLDRIVLTALAKAPERRFQQIREMLGELVRFRQSYDEHTRRTAADAVERFRALVDIADELASLRRELGVEAAGTAQLDKLVGRFPLLADNSEHEPTALPWSRQQVVAVAAAVDRVRAELQTEVEKLRAARSAIHAPSATPAAAAARNREPPARPAHPAVPTPPAEARAAGVPRPGPGAARDDEDTVIQPVAAAAADQDDTVRLATTAAGPSNTPQPVWSQWWRRLTGR